MHTDEKKNYLSGRNPTTKNEQTLAVRRQTTTLSCHRIILEPKK
jgi:hypothetical protein